MRKFLLLAALSAAPLLPASAQTLSINIDTGLQFPAAAQTLSNLLQLLSQGAQVSFLTPTSQPAAGLTKTGGLQVYSQTPSATPPQLTQVQVSTPVPGTSQVVKEVFPLAQPLSTRQPISAQSIVVKAADGQAVPLTSVLERQRQAAWAKAPGLQKKPGGLPPGQLKQLCKKEPGNKLCTAPAPKAAPQKDKAKGNGKH